MTHIRLDKCSEVIGKMRDPNYPSVDSAEFGAAIGALVASCDDGPEVIDSKSELGQAINRAIAPECEASRVACGWTWFDWIIVGYMLLALTCEVMLAAQIMAGQVRWQTVVVAVLSVVGMFGFGVMRGGK